MFFGKPAEWGTLRWRGLLNTSGSDCTISLLLTCGLLFSVSLFHHPPLFLLKQSSVPWVHPECGTSNSRLQMWKKNSPCQCSRWHHCMWLLDGFENLSSNRDIATSLLTVWLITAPWYSLMPTQFQGLKP